MTITHETPPTAIPTANDPTAEKKVYVRRTPEERLALAQARVDKILARQKEVRDAAVVSALDLLQTIAGDVNQGAENRRGARSAIAAFKKDWKSSPTTGVESA